MIGDAPRGAHERRREPAPSTGDPLSEALGRSPARRGLGRLERAALAVTLAILGAGCGSAGERPETDEPPRRGGSGSTNAEENAHDRVLDGASVQPAGERPVLRGGASSATPASPPRPPADGREGYAGGNPWPETPHGRASEPTTSAARCRFEAPEGRELPSLPTRSRPLPTQPRLGLVVVREGFIVRDPGLLLALEARLDRSVAAVIDLVPGPRPSIDLDGLAGLGRDLGLDLVLVDARPGQSREAWLVATASRDLVGMFVDRETGMTSARPPAGVELAARIEQAWLALP